MAGRLRVDYRVVESLINDMKSHEASVQSVYADMTNTVEALVNNGYMEAASANAYVEEFKAMMAPDMESLAQLIGEYYTQLNKICINFEEADNKISSMLC
jgi:WXG100 family type VII secretion target